MEDSTSKKFGVKNIRAKNDHKKKNRNYYICITFQGLLWFEERFLYI